MDKKAEKKEKKRQEKFAKKEQRRIEKWKLTQEWERKGGQYKDMPEKLKKKMWRAFWLWIAVGVVSIIIASIILEFIPVLSFIIFGISILSIIIAGSVIGASF